MILEVTRASETNAISQISFNDNAIKEVVTFWANVKHTSPQFPLDLSPNVTQFEGLYQNGDVPSFAENEDTTFTISGGTAINDLQIVQMKLSFLGDMTTIPDPGNWDNWFNSTESWQITPDGSAFIVPDSNNTEIILNAKSASQTEYFSYQILISFVIENKTYYGVFDPFAKVTNNAG